MKKSLFAMAFTVAVGLSLLSGCGSSGSIVSITAGVAAETQEGTTWPSGTVTLLCGFGAGGSSDLEVRLLATYLKKVTGGTFIVSNVTGANGWMAWDRLLHSAPDGLTIAMVNTPALFYDYLDPSRGISKTMDDFDFICNEVIDYGVLVTKAGTYADINEFVAASKEAGGVTVADVGANGNKHIAIVEMGLANPNSTLTSVHQSGWSDNYAALLGGAVDAVSATYGDIVSVMADGNLAVLCVFNDKRLDVLPNVPTLEEVGYGAVYSAPSRGYFMPKGVTPLMKDAIVAAFKEAIKDPNHVAEAENLGLMVSYMDGDEYLTFLKGQEKDVIALKPELGWK